MFHYGINAWLVEISPNKFLDTKLINHNGTYSTQVYRKPTKIPTNWSSKIPKRYKRNAIVGDLNRSQKISSNFKYEVQQIQKKFLAADYPPKFSNSVINQYHQNKDQNQEDEYIIPPNFFEIPKPFLLIGPDNYLKKSSSQLFFQDF